MIAGIGRAPIGEHALRAAGHVIGSTETNEWRSYTPAEVEIAARYLKRRYKVDILDYEAIWWLRDQHEPGWRDRRDKPPDKMVECLTPCLLRRGNRDRIA